MTRHRPTRGRRKAALLLLLLCAAVMHCAQQRAYAHPLGNFTINHYTLVRVAADRVELRHVVDMAEVPAFQELRAADSDGDGTAGERELRAYAERAARQYVEGLSVSVDGEPLRLVLTKRSAEIRPGVGNLPTLRVECDYVGRLQAGAAGATRRLRFENAVYAARAGWREIVATSSPGVTVFDSTAYGSGVTDELHSYPDQMLAAPLDERSAELSFRAGEAPAGSAALLTRDGRPAAQTRDRLAELIAVPELTPLMALVGLLFAAGLGAFHALSPGHGKAVVGAYLVGSRGTPRHAAFLGLTVTVTHTAGVFALGLLTLFASEYVLPERLLPVLGFASGAIVLLIGTGLFFRRLTAALGVSRAHVHEHEHQHAHITDDGALAHTHGGSAHTHMPPGADGESVTWRSLLALGVSGGLLPCPSALVVLLASVYAQRVGYGLLLVLAFSLGLALTLTAVGLLFLYAGRLFDASLGSSRLFKVLPVLSSLVIACLGAVICYEALGQLGAQGASPLGGLAAALSGEEPSLAQLSGAAVLGLGLVFGLKHATEVDHVVAVSTIVSEQRNLLRAGVIGGLWGVGHTASLLVVGAVVLVTRLAIPEAVGSWLEFAVSLMIIALGLSASVRALRGREDVHVHQHSHDGLLHAHIHFHEEGHADTAAGRHTHAVRRVGIKPVVVGAVHGLAGSAALTLLVLAQIESVPLGLLYLGVFGVGSIFGMLLMSALVGLPFALSSDRFGRFNRGLQTVAGCLSVLFGLWYAYETGVASGLLTSLVRG